MDGPASSDEADGAAGPRERVGGLEACARAGDQDGGAIEREGAEAVDVGGAGGDRLADLGRGGRRRLDLEADCGVAGQQAIDLP